MFNKALAIVGPQTDQPEGLRLAPGQQIAAMGDSITESGGYLRAMQAVFDQQYARLQIPRIINAGISGQKAEEMVARFQRDVVDREPAVATISVGVNDVWHRLDAPHDEHVLELFGRNVERMVEMARSAGIAVYLLSPTIIEEKRDSEGNRRLVRYIDAGKDVAKRHGCAYVNLHAMFLEAVDRLREQAGKERSPERLTRDGVHMEPLGDTLMAVGVLRAFGVPDAAMAATDVSGVVGGSPEGP